MVKSGLGSCFILHDPDCRLRFQLISPFGVKRGGPTFGRASVICFWFYFTKWHITNGHISLSAYVLIGFGLLDFLNRWGLDKILGESRKFWGGEKRLILVVSPFGLHSCLRQSGGAFGAAIFGTAEAVPFRKAAFQERSGRDF